MKGAASNGMNGRRLGTLLASILVATAFVCGGLFHAWLRIERLRLGYSLSKATSHTRSLLRDNARLRLEVATLEAPSRIENLARTRYGMRAPRVNEVEVVRVPSVAKVATKVLNRVAKRGSGYGSKAQPAAPRERGDG